MSKTESPYLRNLQLCVYKCPGWWGWWRGQWQGGDRWPTYKKIGKGTSETERYMTVVKILQWRCCLDCCYQKSPVWGTPVWVEAWVMRGLRDLVRFTVWSPREWSWWKTDVWKSSLWTRPWKPGQSQLGSWRGWELRADLCLSDVCQQWLWEELFGGRSEEEEPN